MNFNDTAHRPWRNKYVAFALQQQRSLKLPEMYKVTLESEKSERVQQLIVIFCLRMPLDIFLIIRRNWTAKHATSGQ